MIAGYTKGQGRRSGRFGSLVLGVWRGDELEYAGNVGTGFTDRDIDELLAKLRPLETGRPPFREVPKMPKVRKADVVWVRPELVAEVEFVEWTHDGRLRAPSFQGLREDKSAREVHREEPLPNEIRRGKRVVKLSNLDKVFWPDEGTTKGDLLALLPLGCAGRDSAHPRPAVHDEALPRRDQRRALLPEGRAAAHARLDPHGRGRGDLARAAAANTDDQGAARQRRARAALDGEHGLYRPEHVVLAGRQARPARLRPLRPRPGRRCRLPGGDRGRAARQAGPRCARARRVPEDEW